jgi:hypothetical protein
MTCYLIFFTELPLDNLLKRRERRGIYMTEIYVTVAVVFVVSLVAFFGGCYLYYLFTIKIPLDMAAHNMERTKKGLDTDYVKYLSDTQFATYYNTISSDILNMQLDTNEDNLCAIFDVVKKERFRRAAEVKHLDYLSGVSHLNDNKQLLTNYLKGANPENYTKEFSYFLNNYYGKNGAKEIAQQAIAAYVKFDSGVSNVLEIKRKDDKDIRQYAEDLYAASAPPQGLGFGIITTSVVEAAIYTALDNNERKKQMANQMYKTSSVANSGIAAHNNLAAGKIKSLYDTYVETMKSIINKM